MISKPDSVYYSERLAIERTAAASADNEAARAAHQALADQYALRLADSGTLAEAGPEPTFLVIVPMPPGRA
jgi:hypothetical protein